MTQSQMNLSARRPQPLIMADLALKPGERGTIIGETRTGKSTLAEQLIAQYRLDYPKARVVILDSKPRFKAERELDGRPTRLTGRYKKWDWGEVIPGSVVIPLNNPTVEIKHAWSLGYQVVIGQIEQRKDIWKLNDLCGAAYENRVKGRPLLIYADELNNFFRTEGKRASGNIIMVITSGGERSVGFLGAAQRPRNISVEAMESLTKLYWFKSPFVEDVKHLRNMGVPETARPPKRYYQFYFFDKMSSRQGYCQLALPAKGAHTNGGRRRESGGQGRSLPRPG